MTTQTVLNKETGFLTVGDQEIGYILNTVADVVTEEATTFLLIPGAMGNAVTTASLAQELAARFPEDAIFQVDLPGHGISVGKPLQSIFEIAKLLKVFVEQMKASYIFTDKLVLIGHSMGGSIAMMMALLKLDVKHIVLLSSAPEWSSMGGIKEIPDLHSAIKATFVDMMTEDFKVNTSAELQAQLLPQIEAMSASADASVSDIQALLDFDIREQISEIEIPVLVIYGDQDATATIKNQQLMINSFPNSIGVLIPGASHTTVIKNFIEIADAIEKVI